MKLMFLALALTQDNPDYARCVVSTSDYIAASVQGCADEQAKRLEPSAAAAQEIAIAATVNCRAVLNDARSRLNICEAGLGSGDFIKRMEDVLRDKVIRAVVEIRAKRATP